MSVLLDENSVPRLREVVGSLMADAEFVDIAVANIRLAAIDITPEETKGIGVCRIMLGRLDAGSFAEFGRPAHARIAAMQSLLRFLNSGRVQIRSAGVHTWVPDFSLYRHTRDSFTDVCLVGAHYFQTPPTSGPSLTCVVSDESAVALALRRFDELWSLGHDVHEAIVSTIARTIGDVVMP